MSLFSGLNVVPKTAAAAQASPSVAEHADPATGVTAGQQQAPAQPPAAAPAPSAFSFVKPPTPTNVAPPFAPQPRAAAGGGTAAGPSELSSIYPPPGAATSASPGINMVPPIDTNLALSRSNSNSTVRTENTVSVVAGVEIKSNLHQQQSTVVPVEVNPELMLQQGQPRKKTRRANAPGFLAKASAPSPVAAAAEAMHVAGAAPGMVPTANGGISRPPQPPPAPPAVPQYSSKSKEGEDENDHDHDDERIRTDENENSSQPVVVGPTILTTNAANTPGGESAKSASTTGPGGSTTQLPLPSTTGQADTRTTASSSKPHPPPVEEQPTPSGGGGMVSSMFSFLRGAVSSSGSSSTTAGGGVASTGMTPPPSGSTTTTSKQSTPPPPPPPPPVTSMMNNNTSSAASAGTMPGTPVNIKAVAAPSAFGFLQAPASATMGQQQGGGSSTTSGSAAANTQQHYSVPLGGSATRTASSSDVRPSSPAAVSSTTNAGGMNKTLDQEIANVFNCAGLQHLFVKVKAVHEKEEQATLERLELQQKGLQEAQAKIHALESELAKAEEEQLALCESEKFAEAELVTDRIERIKGEIVDTSNRGNNRSTEFLQERESLSRARRVAALQLASHVGALLNKAGLLKEEAESYFARQRDTLETKISTETRRLRAEKQRIETNRDYNLRESTHLAEERQQIDNAITSQTETFQDQLTLAEGKEKVLQEEIAELQAKLAQKFSELSEVQASIGDNRMKISTVQSKFTRQFERMTKTESRLLESKAETKLDVQALQQAVEDWKVDKKALKTIDKRKVFELENLTTEETQMALVLLEVEAYLVALVGGGAAAEGTTATGAASSTSATATSSTSLAMMKTTPSCKTSPEEASLLSQTASYQQRLSAVVSTLAAVRGSSKTSSRPEQNDEEVLSPPPAGNEDDTPAGGVVVVPDSTKSQTQQLPLRNNLVLLRKALDDSQETFRLASSDLAEKRCHVQNLEAKVKALGLEDCTTNPGDENSNATLSQTELFQIEKDKLEAEKKLAIAARNFKEAGRLTAEAKSLEKRKQDYEELQEKKKLELAETQQLLVEKRAGLEAEEKEAKAKEADADICEYLVTEAVLSRLKGGGNARTTSEVVQHGREGTKKSAGAPVSTPASGGVGGCVEEASPPAEEPVLLLSNMKTQTAKECEMLQKHLAYLGQKVLQLSLHTGGAATATATASSTAAGGQDAKSSNAPVLEHILSDKLEQIAADAEQGDEKSAEQRAEDARKKSDKKSSSPLFYLSDDSDSTSKRQAELGKQIEALWASLVGGVVGAGGSTSRGVAVVTTAGTATNAGGGQNEDGAVSDDESDVGAEEFLISEEISHAAPGGAVVVSEVEASSSSPDKVVKMNQEHEQTLVLGGAPPPPTDVPASATAKNSEPSETPDRGQQDKNLRQNVDFPPASTAQSDHVGQKGDSDNVAEGAAAVEHQRVQKELSSPAVQPAEGDENERAAPPCPPSAVTDATRVVIHQEHHQPSIEDDPELLARKIELELTIADVVETVLPDLEVAINDCIENEQFEKADELEAQRLEQQQNLASMQTELRKLLADVKPPIKQENHHDEIEAPSTPQELRKVVLQEGAHEAAEDEEGERSIPRQPSTADESSKGATISPVAMNTTTTGLISFIDDDALQTNFDVGLGTASLITSSTPIGGPDAHAHGAGALQEEDNLLLIPPATANTSSTATEILYCADQTRILEEVFAPSPALTDHSSAAANELYFLEEL
ncbi:unnamed protein product [Amoebophrya sp. A120]|nr:unnamed protein product [Amoebophrya sp. A120]|eukprot:GSA120T00022588001.1